MCFFRFDFFIVAVGAFSFLPSSSDTNLSSLRVLRVFRPLRTINKLPTLRTIMTCIFDSVGQMSRVFLMMLFFLLLFAILGVQLFRGALTDHTVMGNASGGASQEPDRLCGGIGVSRDPLAHTNTLLSFDNIGVSLYTTFQCVTSEDWVEVMKRVQHSKGSVSNAFFYGLIFIGTFFLLNLTTTVLKSKFQMAKNKTFDVQELQKKLEQAEYKLVREWDYFKIPGIFSSS